MLDALLDAGADVNVQDLKVILLPHLPVNIFRVLMEYQQGTFKFEGCSCSRDDQDELGQ